MAFIEAAGAGSASSGGGLDRFDELVASLRTMFRVIFALMLREGRTRYGDSRLGYVWALIDPVILMIILVFLFEFIGRTSPIAASLQVFILTAYVPLVLIRNSIGRAAGAVGGNTGLLQYPQVTPAAIIIARVTLEIATSVVVYFILIVALYYIIDEPFGSWFDDPVGMLVAFVVVVYLAFGSSFLSSGLARVWTAWPNVWSYISRPLIVFSGIMWTLENLPTTGRRLMQYNPFAHVIEWFRSVSIPGFESHSYSVIMILATATITMFVGLLIDRYLVLTGDEEIVS